MAAGPRALAKAWRGALLHEHLAPKEEVQNVERALQACRSQARQRRQGSAGAGARGQGWCRRRQQCLQRRIQRSATMHMAGLSSGRRAAAADCRDHAPGSQLALHLPPVAGWRWAETSNQEAKQFDCHVQPATAHKVPCEQGGSAHCQSRHLQLCGCVGQLAVCPCTHAKCQIPSPNSRPPHLGGCICRCR